MLPLRPHPRLSPLLAFMLSLADITARSLGHGLTRTNERRETCSDNEEDETFAI